jgi:hypothetical protein
MESTPRFKIPDMSTHFRRFVAAAVSIGVTSVGVFAQHPAMPPGLTHEEHLAQMQKDAELKTRGRDAMGFDQDKTTHHFRLYKAGGAIEVVTNEPEHDASRSQIRMHLKTIAEQFSAGDFGKPLATHGELPPGVRTMQDRRSALTFKYEELPGGRVRITTSDAKATEAVHEFLRYQIREHATGDPLTIK